MGFGVGCGFVGVGFPVARAFRGIIGFRTKAVRVVGIEAVASNEVNDGGESKAVMCGYGA